MLTWVQYVIPETIYQTRTLLVFFVLAFIGSRLCASTHARKRLFTVLGVCFLVITTNALCAAVFVALAGAAYFITNSVLPHRLYLFIFTVVFIFLSPFLLYSTLNAGNIFYSFVSYYSLYKLIHYFIEVSNNKAFQRNTEDFFFYILFFPCLCHGPIERINNLRFNSVQRDDYLFGLKKILWGLIKLNFYFYILKGYMQGHIPEILRAYLFAISFYLQLSGDWDIVIGSARILGVKLHENFPRNPFFQSNLTKFWRNSHATIVDWYFSYFYVPLAKNNRFINAKLVCVFVLIIGMHAFFNSTVFPSVNVIAYYALMGLWFGACLVFSKEIERYFKTRRVRQFIEKMPAFFQRFVYGKSLTRYIISIFINFNIFSSGLYYSPLYQVLALVL